MSKTCRECGAKCCKYFCFEIDEPDTYEELEDVRWYLCHKGVTVHIDEDDDWYISIDNRCKMLAADNRCKIYDDRPLICRDYDLADCDHSGGDYDYKAFFKSPEELEAYARKLLGKKKFEAAKIKARAKIEKKHKKKTRKKKKRC
ncbi:MAG: YkgJ family cysteine cluster protein [Planctomycetota bacterium]|nr:YkgJ family cysteine cluster protein [Planctomycetota bacterium]